MITLGLVLAELLLFAKYPDADSCWDVLHIDSVEFEETGRAEMEWCIARYDWYYSRRKGDSAFGFSCWQARHVLESRRVAKTRAQALQMTVAEIRDVARHRLNEKYCRFTNAQLLRRAFEREHARQEARYECMNTEDTINYPWSMGIVGAEPEDGRDPPIDLECWWDGWRTFYVEPFPEDG